MYFILVKNHKSKSAFLVSFTGKLHKQEPDFVDIEL
jgi:hypothetical protein